jgi:hypothetical protein
VWKEVIAITSRQHYTGSDQVDIPVVQKPYQEWRRDFLFRMDTVRHPESVASALIAAFFCIYLLYGSLKII